MRWQRRVRVKKIDEQHRGKKLPVIKVIQNRHRPAVSRGQQKDCDRDVLAAIRNAHRRPTFKSLHSMDMGGILVADLSHDERKSLVRFGMIRIKRERDLK